MKGHCPSCKSSYCQLKHQAGEQVSYGVDGI
jgi:hypothetical protein